LNDFKLDAQKKDLAGGLLISANDGAALGSIQVEAWGDVVVDRDASASLFDKESYAAVASVFSANQYEGAPISIRSLTGSLRARGRAVSSVGDHNNSAALVELFAKDDVVLESLAAGAEAGPTLTVEDLWNNASAADGTVRLQSCQGDVVAQAGVQVRAAQSLLVVDEGAVSLDPAAAVDNPFPQLAACDEVATLFAAGCSAFGSAPIADADSDGVPDACDAGQDDCDDDGVPDSEEVDCDGNGVPDDCQTFADCNGNGIPDVCDIASGFALDCNNNGIPDSCDIASGFSVDCNQNGIPDSCDIVLGISEDCNNNNIPDSCDIQLEPELDCDVDSRLDSCQIVENPHLDCDGDGFLNACALDLGAADCNFNGIPDICDINLSASADCNQNGVPDECEPDCDLNGIPDDCDLLSSGLDADGDQVLDACEVAALPGAEAALFAGGAFSQAGSNLDNRLIAGWNGSAWSVELGGGVDSGAQVRAAALGSLILAGRFDSAGDVPVANIKGNDFCYKPKR
jgi:hypothetical protein